ncbi:mechanosensitive ion channel [Candidatus Halobeggiatoa sp. HSG11]|nr:mechanosensitive ion channel [Candidatus Halobeggiatoa sp. HSG11]
MLREYISTILLFCIIIFLIEVIGNNLVLFVEVIFNGYVFEILFISVFLLISTWFIKFDRYDKDKRLVLAEKVVFTIIILITGYIFEILFISILISIWFIGVNRYYEDFKFLWVGQIILTIIILITGEIILTNHFSEIIYLIETGFNILWWLVSAYLIYLAINILTIIPYEKKYGAYKYEEIAHDRLVIIITFNSLALFGIAIFVYEAPIIGLIILVQIYIIKKLISQRITDKNEFDRRLRFNWVKIGEFEEGRVVKQTQKMVSINTRYDNIINIPNHVVSQSVIKNFEHPDCVYWSTIKIKAYSFHPPTKVKKILLDALLNADKILAEPSPVVVVSDISNDMMEYTLAYCSDDYASKDFIKEEVFIRILHHFKQANISQVIESQHN